MAYSFYRTSTFTEIKMNRLTWLLSIQTSHLHSRSLYPSPAIPLNGIKGLIDPDFIGGRRYLKEGWNFILGKSSKRFSGLSEVILNTFNDFNVACDYGAPRKPLATYTSTQSTWYHRRSKLDQNKRMIPSPVSKMPARHAIGRTGVRVFDPSAPLSNLIVGTGRIWEWEVRGLEQKIGIVTVTGSKKQFDMISRETSSASRYGIWSRPSFCPSRAPHQSFCV